MNRFTFIIILLMAGLAFGAEHHEFALKNASGDTVWSVKADTTIYSKEFSSDWNMTLHYVAYDTCHLDSVYFVVKYQTPGVKFNGTVQWTTQDSIIVTADSVVADWEITNNPVSNSERGRIAVDGGSANQQDGPAFFKPQYKGADLW